MNSRKTNKARVADKNSLLLGGGLGRGLCLFPGSFEPFTKGHADIVERALTLFDEIIIGVGYNDTKTGLLTLEGRVSKIRELYADNARVKVAGYSGLTADFAKANGVTAIVRGVRTMKDFEYEMQMADVNRQISGIETILLPASPQYASLSSTLVRELSRFGHDISAFLP